MPTTADLRRLFNETQDRFPYQKLSRDQQSALFSDWREECQRVGFQRFEEGVKRARGTFKFFPLIAEIKDLIPRPRNPDLEFKREMADLRSAKKGGETFYALPDVFREYSRRVLAGEIEQTPRSLACARLWAGNAQTAGAQAQAGTAVSARHGRPRDHRMLIFERGNSDTEK